MMEQSSVNITSEEATRSFNAKKLGELLGLLGIKEGYYVDDYNKIDPLPSVIEKAKRLFREEKKDELSAIFSKKVELNVPDDDVFGDQIRKMWDELQELDKDGIITKIMSSEGGGFNTLDYTRTKMLKDSFPKEYLKLINPDEWDETFKELEKKYEKEGKVLILFDQDLTQAKGERFKSGVTKGQHLILNLKNSSIKDNVYCALITHLISDTSQELTERNKVIEELNKNLTERDFFALSKDRIKSPDLLCDGIKKTLLNGYCEEIKERSKQILEDAQKNTLSKVLGLDTYDFDHTVLRSSYSEGVWEMNTLFRIAGNFYNDEVKTLMEKSNYAKNVNPLIKKAKTISDVRFEIEPGTIPYKQKYRLRHYDIYEPGDVINKLHLPIDNGDIFEITDWKGKGYYILVGQECDLMMRTAPSLGSRSAETATLLKVKDFTRKALDEVIVKFYETNRFDNHFFSNKFKLDYFIIETNNIGLVKFIDSYVVNLDVLDLCVFNSDGTASLDLATRFDVDLVSTSWEHRHQKLVDMFKKQADSLDKLIPEINKLAADVRDQIKKRIGVKLGAINDLGKADNYQSRKFDFGIKRIKRLKLDGAKYLLERYYHFHSRTAEQHDFAFEEKFIKEGLKASQEDNPVTAKIPGEEKEKINPQQTEEGIASDIKHG